MRGKRSKQYRKLMQQYGITFGFREPYQVLRETLASFSYSSSMSLADHPGNKSGRRHHQRCRTIQDGPGWRSGESPPWKGQAEHVFTRHHRVYVAITWLTTLYLLLYSDHSMLHAASLHIRPSCAGTHRASQDLRTTTMQSPHLG